MNQLLGQNIKTISNTGEKKHVKFLKYFATLPLISWILASTVFTISVSANSATKIQ